MLLCPRAALKALNSNLLVHMPKRMSTKLLACNCLCNSNCSLYRYEHLFISLPDLQSQECNPWIFFLLVFFTLRQLHGNCCHLAVDSNRTNCHHCLLLSVYPGQQAVNDPTIQYGGCIGIN